MVGHRRDFFLPFQHCVPCFDHDVFVDIEKWQTARLIPTSGISGQDEQEMRATSALLAVLSAVKEYGVLLLRPLGAPAGTVSTFIEVPFTLMDGRKFRPDGVIRIERGSRVWTALVEVKTGTAELSREQVEAYLDVAKENEFDAVITISNEIASSAADHPVEVDKRKLKKVALHHLSWAEVLSAAVTQRVHRGVSDPDQAWILAELIRYLEHPKSGALDFSDMGGAWVGIREAVAAGTLRSNDRGIAEVIARWDQLLRFAALRLERELGSGVQVVTTKKDAADPATGRAKKIEELVNHHRLIGVLRIPNTVGDLTIVADLRSSRCHVSTDVSAPAEGRALTRLNWLTRQLMDSPDQLRLDAYVHLARSSTSELLKTVRANPAVLLPDAKADVRRFRITATSPLGTKRGTGKASFIDSVLASVDGFYEVVTQRIRPWQAKAPQLPKEGSAVEAAGIDLTTNEDTTEMNVDADRDTAGIGQELTNDIDSEEDSNITSPVDDEDSLVNWDSQHEQIAEEREQVDGSGEEVLSGAVKGESNEPSENRAGSAQE
jgi:hypothetical protein